MSKTLEEIFEQEKKAVGPKPKEQRMAPKSLEDIFGATPGGTTKMIEVDPQAEEAALRTVGKGLFALPIGASRGATAGWSKEIEPQAFKQIAEDYPVITGMGSFAGSFGPASALAKGVGIASKLPALSFLNKPGFLSGAATGTASGLIQNPEGSSVMQNALVGAGGGGIIGAGAKKLGSMIDEAETFKRLQEAGYSKTAKDEIDKAVKQLESDYINPKKSALTKILSQYGTQRIKINPDYLRGLQREKDLGLPGKKGGLDRLANILESKYGAQNATVSPLRAQRLKEYFQELANYQKRRPYEAGSQARNEGAGRVASILKGQLESLDDRVSGLNEPMSEALTLRSNIKDMARTAPISLLSAKPYTDKGQQVLELDRLAKSRLGQLGKTIREAKQLEADPEKMINPLASMQTGYRLAKRAIGRVAKKPYEKTPAIGKDALLRSIIGAQVSEEEEE